MTMLIPLQDEQAKSAPFPPGVKVSIHMQNVCYGSGTVTGVLLKVNGPNSCQMISQVQVTKPSFFDSGANGSTTADSVAGATTTESIDIKFTQSDLRFSVGCPVTVKTNNNVHHGIVMGTVDVPMNMKTKKNSSSSDHLFWYSIYNPSNGLIQHEVVPEDVTFRHDTDSSPPLASNSDDNSTAAVTLEDNIQTHQKDQTNDTAKQDFTPHQEVVEEDQNGSKPDAVASENSTRTKITQGIPTTTADTGKRASAENKVIEKDHGGDMSISSEEDDGKVKSSNQDKKLIKLDPDGPNRNKSSNNSNKNKQQQSTNTKEKLKEIMNKNWGHEIFVGNIPSESINDQDLRTILGEYGKIRFVRMMKGCAKVLFEEERSARQCIEEMHNQVVFFAQSRLPMRVMPINELDMEFKILIQDLNKRNIREEDVRATFSLFGEVVKVYLIRNLQNVQQGSAIVIYKHVQSVVDAVAYYGSGNKDFIVNIPDRKSHERHYRMFHNTSRIYDHQPNPQKGGGLNNNYNQNKKGPSEEGSCVDYYGPPTTKDAESLKRKNSGSDNHYREGTKFPRLSTDEASSAMQSTLSSIQQNDGKTSPYVVQIFIPLTRKLVTGCLIGNKGMNHKALLKCTNCRITAIQDEEIKHAVEVTGDTLIQAENGANQVLHHLLVGLDHLLDENLRRKCYIDYAGKNNSPSVYSRDVSSGKSVENVPPIEQITTVKNVPRSPSQKTYHSNPDDIHYRLIMPLPTNDFRDFIIGPQGKRHKELMKYLGCRMITLREGNERGTSHIEVYDYSKRIAEDSANKLFDLIRDEYGNSVRSARIKRLR